MISVRMSKKILVITEVFYPESTMLNDFIPEIVKRGFEVEVLCRQPSYPLGKVYEGYRNDKYSVDDWNGVKVHRMKVVEGYRESKLKKILNYWAFIRLGNQIAKKIGEEFDRVLVYQTGPLTVALPGVTIKRRYGIPLTVWTCDIWPDAVWAYGFPRVFPLPQLVRSIIRKVYRNADRILVSSKKFGEAINQHIEGREIIYTPNWFVAESEAMSPVKLNKGTFHFLFAGNISISQNLENVIKGWGRAGLNNAVLNIIGEGSKSDFLKKLVIQNHIPNVVFHGRWPSNQMQSLFSQADALVLPLLPIAGLDKTEPYKIQSYLKAGKPIFGVVEGAAREIIEHYELGVCAAPLHVDDIARGFAEMMEYAKEHQERIERNAFELLDGRFNRLKTIDRIISNIE